MVLENGRKVEVFWENQHRHTYLAFSCFGARVPFRAAGQAVLKPGLVRALHYCMLFQWKTNKRHFTLRNVLCRLRAGFPMIPMITINFQLWRRVKSSCATDKMVMISSRGPEEPCFPFLQGRLISL